MRVLLLTLVIGIGAAVLPSADLGGSGAAASAPPSVAEQPAGEPAWVRDPLAPPSLTQ